MLHLIDSKSPQTLLSELDLHSMPGSQVGVQNCRWTRINLKNALTPNSRGPFEFQLANNNRSFVNLKRSWIVWNLKITRPNGDPYPFDDDNQVRTAFIQSIAGTIGKQYTLHINSQVVESSNVNTAYRYYLENELNLSEDVKKANLSVAGYRIDTAQEDEQSTGWLARSEPTLNGQSIEVACRLPLDLASQNKLLLNFMDIRLTVYTNESRFVIENLQAAVPQDLKVHINDVYVMLNEYDLVDGYMNTVEKYLQESRIQYPLTSVQMRQLYIEPGRMDSPHFTAFSTHCPKRITVALVAADAFNGHYQRSPFNFQHFNLKNLYVDVSGVLYPSRPWNLDYATNKIAPAFMATQDALGLSRSNETNGITMDMYKKGWAIYVIELSPTVHEPDLFDLIKPGNVTISMEFSQQVPAGGIYAVILGEFDAILSLDASRNPHIDTIL